MAITLTTNTAYPSGFSRNGGSDDFTGNEELHAAVTAKSIYLEHVSIQNGATARTFTINDATTAVIGPVSLAINGTYAVRFVRPLQLTAAQALNVDASGGSVGANVIVEGFVK